MEPVLTPEQMRLADEATIASGTAVGELMERAAYACAVTARRMLAGAAGRRVVVVCGKGNNGGDGIACARHLSAAGASVALFLLAEPSGAPAAHLERLRAAGPRGRVRISSWSRAAFDETASSADLIVDAILGTGFAGTPHGAPAEAIEGIAAANRRVLAVDIPSGVAGSDGTVNGSAVNADVTVSIQALKVGNVAGDGAFRNGRVDLADIGIVVGPQSVNVPDAADVAALLPARPPDTHKYAQGVVGILAASEGMTGAAVLAAAGALRMGAGLVRVGAPETCVAALEGIVEALKIPLPHRDGRLVPESVGVFEPSLTKAGAVAFGPGVGRSDEMPALTRRVLALDMPVVVDADGLWGLAEVLSDEPDALSRRAHPTVLTPHMGEFKHLLGRDPGHDRLSEARDAADKWGAVVHLKGRRAVTAAPCGRAWINPTGNPGMATGGTGDVLTGIVTCLIAQGLDAADATWAGAYVHGVAGDVAASPARSLTAGDLAAAIGTALQRIRRARPAAGPLRTVLA